MTYPLPNASTDLSGQVALVTGASSGLGYRFAKVLAAAGAKVAIAARRMDRLEALAAEMFARHVSNRAFLRHFVVDSTHAVVELVCPDFLVGKTLKESELRGKHGLNLVTVRRADSREMLPDDVPVIGGLPGPDFVFQAGDRLVVYGLELDIQKFTDQ